MSHCSSSRERDSSTDSITLSDTDVESEPLLTKTNKAIDESADRPTPLPLLQISILVVLQFAESLTYHLIGPFTPALVVETGVTKGDERKVGHYVGILQSSFFLAEALTVFGWGRISDLIGRKPVLIAELFGIAGTMVSFGLSRTYTGLLLSRLACGALNGGIGVMKSMIAEITDATNVAQAYAITPISWTTGGTIGPLLGGLLAHPSERFPGLFGSSQFMKDYPYFLACSVPAVYSLVMVWITSAYLKETVVNRVPVWQFIRGIFSRTRERRHNTQAPSLPLTAFLTFPVLVCTLNYCTVALIDIAARSLLPVFLTTPLHQGGLEYDTPTVGACLSIMGIANAIVQLFCLPYLYKYLGGKNLFLWSVAASVPMFALCPIEGALANMFGKFHWTVFLSLGVQFACLAATNMAYGCVFVYIAAAAPDPNSIGATNGIAQMVVSVIRTVGPAATGSLYSLTIEYNAMGGWLVWYVMYVFGFLAVASGLLLPRRIWERRR